jgi:Protein of unknown function (DUF2971)
VQNVEHWFPDPDRREALWQATRTVKETMSGLEPARIDRTLGRVVYHYTDLGTAEKLIQSRNLWLTDARYCNDREEMLDAMSVIASVFDDAKRSGSLSRTTPIVSLSMAEKTFLDSVLGGYQASFPNISALVCCFCEGDDSLATIKPPRQPQDILSQWRGYGANGRGACVSFSAGDLWNAAVSVKGAMFQPVSYDHDAKSVVVESIVKLAIADFRMGKSTAIQNGADALSMITPLFKHPGFSEEREWRLVFMLQFAASAVPLYFRSRPDILVPYSDLNSLFGGVSLGLGDVMVGPSNLQDLNEAALGRVPMAPPITKSTIPYRV